MNKPDDEPVQSRQGVGFSILVRVIYLLKVCISYSNNNVPNSVAYDNKHLFVHLHPAHCSRQGLSVLGLGAMLQIELSAWPSCRLDSDELCAVTLQEQLLCQPNRRIQQGAGSHVHASFKSRDFLEFYNVVPFWNNHFPRDLEPLAAPTGPFLSAESIGQEARWAFTEHSSIRAIEAIVFKVITLAPRSQSLFLKCRPEVVDYSESRKI